MKRYTRRDIDTAMGLMALAVAGLAVFFILLMSLLGLIHIGSCRDHRDCSWCGAVPVSRRAY